MRKEFDREPFDEDEEFFTKMLYPKPEQAPEKLPIVFTVIYGIFMFAVFIAGAIFFIGAVIFCNWITFTVILPYLIDLFKSIWM